MPIPMFFFPFLCLFFSGLFAGMSIIMLMDAHENRRNHVSWPNMFIVPRMILIISGAMFIAAWGLAYPIFMGIYK